MTVPALALVADDDPDILELVRFRVAGLGYEVLSAGDGASALALARERLPELAILDIGMPGIDGLEVTRRLRADPRTADIAVILLTARVSESDVGTGFDAGAEEYITKPFSPRQLVESVKRNRAQIDLRRREAVVATIADEQAALRRVATAVAAGEASERVFRRVAAECAGLFDAECGQVLRFEGSEGVVVGAHGDGVVEAGARLSLRGGFAVAQVRRTGRAARVDDYRGLRDADPAAARAIPTTAMSGAAAPVRVGAALWGAVAVVSTSRAGAFAEDVEGRLTAFSDLVAMAIANADARARLARLAATDGLTGLPNHRTFHERLTHEVVRARRHGRPLSLVVLDLDRFKRVNDTRGHSVGDRVLAEAARRLLQVARLEDTLARVGGEEFAWILPEADGGQALAAAQRARAEIAASPFPGAGPVTVSAGVCALAEGGTSEELFRLADVALYCAKAQGRDACVLYDPATVSLAWRDGGPAAAGGPAAVRALAEAIARHEPVVLAHFERVAGMAERLALAAGWTGEQAGLLADAALLHALGDDALPGSVPLSREQLLWIRRRGDRHDGGSIPEGAVPEGAGLLAVAHAWDVMTEARADGPSMTVDEAWRECRRQRGTRFAPAAVDALERVLAELGPPMLAGAGRE